MAWAQQMEQRVGQQVLKLLAGWLVPFFEKVTVCLDEKSDSNIELFTIRCHELNCALRDVETH